MIIVVVIWNAPKRVLVCSATCLFGVSPSVAIVILIGVVTDAISVEIFPLGWITRELVVIVEISIAIIVDICIIADAI